MGASANSASPITISIDLPIDDAAWDIARHCTRPYRLSRIIAQPIGRRLIRANFEVNQDKSNYLALIDCLIEINRWSLNQWPFPSLYESGIMYRQEPFGQEVWQTIPAMYLSGLGDCEDLVAARVSELRNNGHDSKPVMVKTGRSPSGGRLFHFKVKHRNGRTEDPSRVLGMR